MTSEPRRPLLGSLVTRGFGAGSLEVMATYAVTALLHENAVAASFTQWLAHASGVTIPDSLTFRPEAPLPQGRIDIAGFLGDARIVVIEAKFGAQLTAEQLRYYLDEAGASVLVVLVPDQRRTEACNLLAGLRNRIEELAMASVVLTWDEVCDALDAAGADTCDVEQFRSLCEVAGGLDVSPLSPSDLGVGRDARQADLHRLTDATSARLHELLAEGRLNPQRQGDHLFSGYRYVCPTAGYGTCFAVGVRPFDLAPSGPLWLRWHRDTGSHATALRVIESALDRGEVTREQDDEGHLYVRLEPLTGVGGQSVVADLVEQVLRIESTVREALDNAFGSRGI